MNILLIAPASGTWRHIGRKKVFNGRTLRFSLLPLLTVAELSPKEAKVTLVDEQFDDIPDGAFDLVGISAMTALAPRAYELCHHFRARGIPTVLGGYHATLNPEEALEHADAIVCGPAYGAWEAVCEDVQRGQLKGIYQGRFDAVAPKSLPRHLLAEQHYSAPNATCATFGCKNTCKFCSIAKFYKSTFHKRPIEDVVEEVSGYKKRFFMFLDDNLTMERDYAIALFKALKPLKKRWVTQSSLTIAEDAELMAAMRDAGCVGVFVGLETFNPNVLEEQQKTFNTPAKYKRAVRIFHQHGMYVVAGTMVGFDHDNVTVFRETLDALEDAKVDIIQLAILTPQPGTGLHEEMRDRIVDWDWEHYDYRHAVFQPAGMRRDQLQDGADWLIREFYRPWRIARRLLRWTLQPHGWHRWRYPLTVNLAYLGRVIHFKIRGCDPSRQTIKEQCVHKVAKVLGRA